MSILCLGLVSCSHIPVFGQSSLPGDERMNGKGVEAAFEAQRMVLQQNSAAIYLGTRPIGYGVIMSTDGYILTKRSELFQLDAKTNERTHRWPRMLPDGQHSKYLKGYSLAKYVAALDNARRSIRREIKTWRDRDLDKLYKLNNKAFLRILACHGLLGLGCWGVVFSPKMRKLEENRVW